MNTNAVLLAVVLTLGVLACLIALPSCIRECRKQKGDLPKVTPAPQQQDNSSDSDSESDDSSEPEPSTVTEPIPAVAEPIPAVAEPIPAVVEPAREDQASDLEGAQPIEETAPSAVLPAAAAASLSVREGESIRAVGKLPPLENPPIPPPVAKLRKHTDIPADR